MQLNALLAGMFQRAGLPVPAPMPPAAVVEPAVDIEDEDEDADERRDDVLHGDVFDIDGNTDSDAEDIRFARRYSGRDCPIFDMSDGYGDGPF